MRCDVSLFDALSKSSRKFILNGRVLWTPSEIQSNPDEIREESFPGFRRTIDGYVREGKLDSEAQLSVIRHLDLKDDSISLFTKPIGSSEWTSMINITSILEA